MLSKGDRVKPVETFDFRRFAGPKDLDDIGTVIRFDPFGDPIVEWDSGDIADHLTTDSDPQWGYSDYGVVPA